MADIRLVSASRLSQARSPLERVLWQLSVGFPDDRYREMVRVIQWLVLRSLTAYATERRVVAVAVGILPGHTVLSPQQRHALLEVARMLVDEQSLLPLNPWLREISYPLQLRLECAGAQVNGLPLLGMGDDTFTLALRSAEAMEHVTMLAFPTRSELERLTQHLHLPRSPS